MKGIKTKEKVLLDSSATHNFINYQMAKRLGVTTLNLRTPRKIKNMDLTENHGGDITWYTDLEIAKDNKKDIQRFYLTNLGKDRMLFGFPWCLAYQPQIDWEKWMVEGTEVTLHQINNETHAWVTKLAIIGKIISMDHCELGDQVWMGTNKASIAQEWAEKMQKGQKKNFEAIIPPQYMDYKEVFSEEVAKWFPLERDNNHEIQFTANIPKTFPCKIYLISKNKTNFLQT